MSNKLMICESNRKKGGVLLFGSKWSWKESGIMTQGRREVEVAIHLLNNDKNNFTAKNVLSYF